jgi:hypothetical protein
VGFVGSLSRHTGTTAAAPQQPRRQVALALLLAGVSLAPHGFLLAHGLIKILRHNDEFRDLDDLPLVFRIRPGDPPAGMRILDHPQPVPDKPTAIKIVIQNAGPTLGIAVDGRCVPDSAARRAKAVAIEPMGDIAPAVTSPASRQQMNGWAALDAFNMRCALLRVC